MKLKYRCSYAYSQKCEPMGSLGFHLSRGWSPVTIYKPLDNEGEVQWAGEGTAAIMVMLFAHVHTGSRWCRKRIDQAIVYKGHKRVWSRMGKFQIEVVGIEGELMAEPSRDDMALLRARSAAAKKAFFDVSSDNEYSFEYARVVEDCQLRQPEGMVPGEFYWFYQSQYGQHMSVEMHMNHLNWALFVTGYSEHELEKDAKKMQEVTAEKLAATCRCISYCPDMVDNCAHTFDVAEKTGLLPTGGGLYICPEKKMLDIASCPLDVEDHLLACGDCEDHVTMAMNQSFQDKSAQKHGVSDALLKSVLGFESKYVFCAATVLTVNDTHATTQKSLLRRNVRAETGEYDMDNRDHAEFGPDLTSHMTMVGLDRNLVLSVLDGKMVEESNEPFLVECTRWMKLRPESDPEAIAFKKKFRSFPSKKFFRFRVFKPTWYLTVTALYSEELRRLTGKGEFVTCNRRTNKKVVLMKDLLNNKKWLDGTVAITPVQKTTKESDAEFAKAMQRVSKAEGYTFLPREGSLYELKTNQKRVGLLTAHPIDWVNNPGLQETLTQFMNNNNYRFETDTWTFAERMSLIIFQVYGSGSGNKDHPALTAV